LRGARDFGGVHRFAAFGLCATLAGWSWWSAQASGYAGLPVNTLGQITGDLILMGLVAPMARRDLSRDRGAESMTAGPSPLGALARAAHRIQLLDVRLCLPQLTAAAAARHPVPRQSSGSSPTSRDSVLAAADHSLQFALSSAIANDACVEILLPDPEESAGLDFVQRFGVLPAHYRGALSQFVKDLDALSAAAESGRLDVRLYAEPSSVSLVRCDQRIWMSLHPEGPADASDYLTLDQAGENTQVLQAYFNRLYTTARPARQTRGDPSDPDADPGIACAAATAGTAVADRGR
jgi:hypothetical protein